MKRTKIDIANERAQKKQELSVIIDRISEETLTEEQRSQIEKLEAEIEKLEAELLKEEVITPAPQPTGQQKIRVTDSKEDISKSYRLLVAIRNVIENRQQDTLTEALNNAGREEFGRAGIASNGQIIIPDTRAGVFAGSGHGLEAIATEKLDLIGPLYSELVLQKVGATFLSGLVSDVSIPVYEGTTVNWAAETASASEGAGAFKEIKLRPKRLTAMLDISRQFLLQDSTSAEALLRSDILEAIRQKLEQTLLGAEAGTATRPAGLFAPGSILIEEVKTYKDILNVELELLKSNAQPKNYLASPLAYANLRQIAKPESAVTDKNLNVSVGSSIVDSNSVSGIPLIVSSNVYAFTAEDTRNFGGYVVGDFSNFIVGQWGNIDLTIDPYTLAYQGVVRLVVNAYFDAVLKRPSLRAVLTTTDTVPPTPSSKKQATQE